MHYGFASEKIKPGDELEWNDLKYTRFIIPTKVISIKENPLRRVFIHCTDNNGKSHIDFRNKFRGKYNA